ncbi:MAG: recombinase family protein, partial [Lachnospiraceae bacterium]
TREGIQNWDGSTKWQSTTLNSMLKNEKYKGDAILQKSYTVDFLSKKRAMNKGEIQKYCVEENHDAIIDAELWECVQLEMKWRRQYCKAHGTNSFSHNTENNPFASKLICGNCNRAFARKGWQGSNGIRKVWQCGDRYKVKGVVGCNNRHVGEETLEKAYLMAWNAVLENRERCLVKWKKQMEGEDLREKYHAIRFVELTESAAVTEELDIGLMLATLECMKVCEDGMLLVRFYDGTEIECRNEGV